MTCILDSKSNFTGSKRTGPSLPATKEIGKLRILLTINKSIKR